MKCLFETNKPHPRGEGGGAWMECLFESNQPHPRGEGGGEGDGMLI